METNLLLTLNRTGKPRNDTGFDSYPRNGRYEKFRALADSPARPRAEADSRAATSQINVTRNQISDEVWRAYSNVKTAFRQRKQLRPCYKLPSNLMKRPWRLTNTASAICSM